jgi:predicted TIM-barrel fold metal-dependent hydrolase
VHFLPPRVQAKVWQYFADGETHYGVEWPLAYAVPDDERLAILDRLGVRAFPTLPYPHKGGMAAWLNDWSAEFAAAHPDVLPSATFYPEPEAPFYVAEALHRGVRIFKVHVQVGRYDPRHPQLDAVWARLEEAGTPVVIHCGSGPQPGRFTGPEPIRRLLRRHPKLTLIVAHMGMPEYGEFLDICLDSPAVYLDTTMAFTAFVDDLMPFPAGEEARLHAAGERIVFGSDFPNIPYGYRDALTAVTAVRGIDDAWLRGVLHDNAAHLFGIGLPSG